MYVQPRGGRIGSVIAATIMTAVISWVLIAGLAGLPRRAAVDRGLSVFRIAPAAPPPPARVVPKHTDVSRRSGRAAPPNLRSHATQVAAPRPIVVVPPPPPPVVVALKPFAGNQATQGATPVRGPGTGAGGEGDGTGSGGWGDGDGDGGDETPPRWRRGRLRDSDYPRDIGAAGVHGTVSVRFMVWTDGRVRDCRVTRSSGNDILDETTCRLITQRFRYDPSRDADGRPVPSYLLENHTWVVDSVPGDE